MQLDFEDEPPKTWTEKTLEQLGSLALLTLSWSFINVFSVAAAALALGALFNLMGAPLIGVLLGVVLGCAFGTTIWYYFVLKPHREPKTKDSHGSARFAGDEEAATLASDEGLLIGLDRKTDALLTYAGPAHLLTLAPTRSGKGVGTLIPNLLKVDRSVIVIDPKGENARITGETRKKLGALHVLDPFGISGHPSSAFNPLAELDAASLDLGEDASALADALVVDPPDQVKDAHWNEEAKALLTGIILWVVCHEPETRRTLGTIRELVTLPMEKLAELLVRMQDSTEAHGLIARSANRQIGKPEREAASVLSNAQRHTHFLDSPRMVKVTGQSDFRFADLRRGTVSVFIVLPPDRLDIYARWLRLVIAQGLQDIVRDAQRASEAPGSPQTGSRPPALFLMDEFASLGRLAAVERAMGLMAGYGVQLWPILQDLSQLKALYGDRANTFMANSGVIQAFGVNDYETAKWLSLTIGQETREYKTKSSAGGENEGLLARDLLTPDEIMRLKSSLQILKLQGMHPLIAKKIVYWQDQRFSVDVSATAPEKAEKKVLRALR